MSDLNEVTLIGNLGKDPEVRYTGTGKAVCTLSLATNRVYKDAKSEKCEETEWHRVIVWEASAEACGAHLSKGDKVCVKGRLQTRKWTDKENVERYSTEIVSQQVLFLHTKKPGATAPPPHTDGDAPPPSRARAADPMPGAFAPPPAAQPGQDDIPF